MVIEIFTGTPGSGKSASAMQDMMWHILDGGIVACNFKLVPDWALRLAKSTFRRARKDPVYARKKAQEYWKRVFFVGDADTVLKLSQQMKPKRNSDGSYRKGSESLERFCKPAMAKKREGMAKLYIDEAQFYFNSRDWMKNKGFIEFFTQHRKLRWDVIMIAHSITMLDKQIRNLIEYETSFRNMQNVKLLGHKVFKPLGPVFMSLQKLCGEGPGSGNKTTPLCNFTRLNMRYAMLYDSMEIFAFDTLTSRISRQPAENLYPKGSGKKKRKLIFTGGGKAETENPNYQYAFLGAKHPNFFAGIKI